MYVNFSYVYCILLVWFGSGKNLYNNEHVAIKLVSFFFIDFMLNLCFACAYVSINTRLQFS